jgi:hypothetical protein
LAQTAVPTIIAPNVAKQKATGKRSVNLPSKWKPLLIRLSEASILIVGLLAAWVLWRWFALERSLEPVYVAIGVLLAGLVAARRWLKQQPETSVTKADLLAEEFSPRLRENLLNSVQKNWIENFLKPSILNDPLTLSLSDRPEAVGKLQAQRLLRQMGQETHLIPPEKSLISIFNESGRKLLILGEPGSGKTTTMLQLAESLIATARQDPAAPIPLILNLSSWAQQRPALTDWLVQEISGPAYDLARDLARSGIALNQFLYLLDGLDEVLDRQDRAACTEAINEFKASHQVEMVICSRTAEYEALANQLVMGSAVEIQPLTDEQINAYLSYEGLELQAVRATLVHDEPLRGLAQTPLMLGLMTLAYRGLSREELKPLADKEARRRHLFDHYVAQMFARRPLSPDSPYTQSQANRWLTNLARGMVKHGQSIFYIEKLQPTWLENDRWYQPIAGLIGGLIGVLIFGLLGGLIFGLLNGLIFGLGFGLIVGSTVGLVSRRFRLAEELSWHIPSQQELWSAIKVGLIFGLTAGLVSGLIGVLIVGVIDGLRLGLFFALTVGLLGGLLAGLQTFARPRETTRRIQPNQGVRQSARNSIRMGLIGVLIIGPIGGLRLGLGLFFGLTVGLLGGLMLYGGLAVIQHYGLRWLLARAGVLPYPLRDRL